MKLVSYKSPGGDNSFGLVNGDGIVDLRERLRLPDLKALLSAGVENALAFAVAPTDYKLSDVQLLPPIPNPAHIFGIGYNTHSHLKEAAAFFKKEMPVPEYPTVFLRIAESQVGHGAPLVSPSVSGTLDYEGEVAVVIGKPGRYIKRADALAHIAGISCYNDGSVRGYQLHSSQVTPAKNFPSSGSFGPWLVTLDEVGPLDELQMKTRINGEQRQHLVMSDLCFDFAQLIEYVSQPFQLQPGDVFVTGSPAGIGAIQGHYLRPGDVVEIDVQNVGTLRNTVVAEAT